MTRLVLAALLLFLPLGCAAGGARREMSRYLQPGETSEADAHFLGNFRDAFAEHVRDCGEGLSFTVAMFSASVSRDFDRVVRSFE